MPTDFDVDVFRVLAAPDDDVDYDGRLLGVGVDMPESDVYVDWRREAFPDELDDPHVSVYGSVEDLQKATGNDVEYIDSEDVATEGLLDGASEQAAVGELLAAASQAADPMVNGHDLDPETGEGTCEQTGEAIEAETMGDLEEDCPHCGEPLSVFGRQPPSADASQQAATVDAVALAYPPGGQLYDGDGWEAFLDDLSEHGDVFQLWKGVQTHPEDDLENHDHTTYVALEADADVTDIEAVLADHPDCRLSINAGTVGPMDAPDDWDAAASDYTHAVGDAGDTTEQAAVDEVPAMQSDWSVRELDGIAAEMDVLSRAEPEPGRVIWRSADQEIAYFADVPEKYTTEIGREAFVPPEAAADVAQEALDARDGDGASEPARRARQLIEAHSEDRPLPPEYVVEIEAFHATADEGTSAWGGQPAADWAASLVDEMQAVDEAQADTPDDAVAADGPAAPVAQAAVAASAGAFPGVGSITKAGSNELDVEALPEEYQEALEADDFLVYGKASIEQYDRTDDPIKIEMEALEAALDRFFQSEKAPGIISLYHDDIPVGMPVREYELEEATTVQLESPDGEPEAYEFEAGDKLTTHVEDGDGDGRPELWLLSNLANDSEVAKQTRLRALEGELNGYSVTIHRNDDDETETGRLVTKVDLHAVTLGEGEIVKNAGSTFGVAEYQAFTQT